MRIADFPDRFNRRCDHPPGGLFFSSVADDGDRLASGGRYLVNQLSEPLLPAGGHYQLGSFGGEQPSAGSPDAGAGSGDDRHLSG